MTQTGNRQTGNRSEHRAFMDIARRTEGSRLTGEHYLQAMHDLFLTPSIPLGTRTAALYVEIEDTTSDIGSWREADDALDYIKRYLGFLKRARTELTTQVH
jgi:hypothetical protein